MATLLEKNRDFYQSLWGKARLIPPQKFNTWPFVQSLISSDQRRLEVGPGLRPRLPIAQTDFVDISEAALQKLSVAGGKIHSAEIHNLPFEDNTFDLVCALDIIEHVEADHAALSELCRVAKPDAFVLLSVPLFMRCWTPFDQIVGHCRRYELDALFALLKANSLELKQSAIYGMQPKSNRVVTWAMNYLEQNPERALWYYNHLFMPIGLRLQKPLKMESGLCNLDAADEIFMCCQLNKSY